MFVGRTDVYTRSSYERQGWALAELCRRGFTVQVNNVKTVAEVRIDGWTRYVGAPTPNTLLTRIIDLNGKAP